MNFQQYMEAFAREHINGSMLCDLDEISLDELGIMSKLHKIRMLNVINGTTTVRPLIERDPYVRCYMK